MLATNARFPAFLLLGSCALFLTPTGIGQAATHSGAQRAADTDPDGLSEDEWAGIRAAYAASRHAADSVEGGYQARNPGQAWRTHFDGSGFLTEPESKGWAWGLELERYGFAGSERDVTGPACMSAEGAHVTYDWDATLAEWYVNDARGLEHGYTIDRRPERDAQQGESPLTFTLAVRGNLQPEVLSDGRTVNFLDEGGASVLTYSGLLVIDADGRELEASFEPIYKEGDGNDRLLLSVEEHGARYPLVIDPIAQQAYLKASNSDEGDVFGSSVAVSGDTVVVGAPNEASNATGVNGNQNNNSAWFSGAAYVFVRSGSSWSQQAYLKASNTGAVDSFGDSVAVSGDTLVIGAPLESSGATGVNGNQSDNSAPQSGAAYVFVRSGTTWSQVAYLKASNTGLGDSFADSVAVSGDTIVVGAHRENSNANIVNGTQGNGANDAGAAYVFVFDGASWSQEAYLKASNSDANDYFGWSVAVSGDRVIVGAPQEDSSATGVNGNQSDNGAEGSGAAYVFVRNGTTWSQGAYLKASNTDAQDRFGTSVTLAPDTLVVGARNEASNATGVNGNQGDNSTPAAGAAYVFVISGTNWSQEAYLKASNSGADDWFGSFVALSGNKVIIGAPQEDSSATGVNGDPSDNSAPQAGAAYAFLRSGTSWSQAAYLKASNTDADDRFGASGAIWDTTGVIGAPWESSQADHVNGNQSDNSLSQAGAAYVFDLGLGVTYCTAGPNSTGAPAAISASGSASVAANDLLLRAESVPNQPGVFFYGPQQASVPFGNGTICIAGQVGRLDVVNATGNVMTFLVDNTSPPSAATQITAGSTWNFQAWFRDPAAGGALFDLSDGLEVLFLP